VFIPFRALGVSALALLTVACMSTPQVQPGSVPAEVSTLGDLPDPLAPYRIGATDVLNVTVFREPEVSLQNVVVDSGGGFQMPLLGRVEARGRTADELSAELTRQLDRYIIAPNVAVNVVTAASQRIVVEGAVNDPGIYQYSGETTLSGAIALADGPTRVARLNQIAIFRSNGTERTVAVFDLGEIRAGRAADPRLQPGDRIVVGFSGLRQAWQDFLQAVPLIGVFTRF